MASSFEGADGSLSQAPTVAGLYVLARIHAWNVSAWRPKTSIRPAMILLNDPAQSSVNPRVVTQLVEVGLLESIDGTLVVTAAGIESLLERPDIIARMRASGAI